MVFIKPTAEPSPALRVLFNVLQRSSHSLVWILQPAALKLDEEDVLEGNNLTRSAINAGQIELVSPKALEDICKSTRRSVIHSKGNERLGRASSILWRLVHSFSQDEESCRVVLTILNTLCENI